MGYLILFGYILSAVASACITYYDNKSMGYTRGRFLKEILWCLIPVINTIYAIFYTFVIIIAWFSTTDVYYTLEDKRDAIYYSIVKWLDKKL